MLIYVNLISTRKTYYVIIKSFVRLHLRHICYSSACYFHGTSINERNLKKYVTWPRVHACVSIHNCVRKSMSACVSVSISLFENISVNILMILLTVIESPWIHCGSSHRCGRFRVIFLIRVDGRRGGCGGATSVPLSPRLASLRGRSLRRRRRSDARSPGHGSVAASAGVGKDKRH